MILSMSSYYAPAKNARNVGENFRRRWEKQNTASSRISALSYFIWLTVNSQHDSVSFHFQHSPLVVVFMQWFTCLHENIGLEGWPLVACSSAVVGQCISDVISYNLFTLRIFVVRDLVLPILYLPRSVVLLNLSLWTTSNHELRTLLQVAVLLLTGLTTWGSWLEYYNGFAL